MADKTRRSLFWNAALYYGVLVVLLLVLVGIVQPEWLKYLPVGGLEGLPDSTALTGEEFMLGQVMTSTQPRFFFENALNLFSAMIGAGYLAIAIALAAFFSLTMLIVRPSSRDYRTEF